MPGFIILVVLLGVTGAGLGAINLILNNLLYICKPSEVLIFAGPKQKKRLPNGQPMGYRIVKGGRTLRTPLYERAFRMDLTNTIIELKVTNAYSKGGIPLAVEGIANIKVAGEEPTIHNAIERLLGKTPKEIEKIAQETLEGNLRGVLASLTPQQINEDKMAFAKSLLEEAEEDLQKLGLTLDNLQIQNISDNVSYLNSLGRKQQADLQRDARIAEAQTRAESIIKTAENDRKTSLKQIEADIEISRAEAERRIQDALTQREAVIAEARGQIESDLARTEAEVSVQQARMKQVEKQLQADVIAPAEAQMKQAIAIAQGEAAKIIEDGKAQAEGIEELAKSWAVAGANARDIFLFQKLETLLKTLVATVPNVEVEKVTFINAQDGNLATQLALFLEQVRQTSGVDVAGAVEGMTRGKSPRPATPKLSPPQDFVLSDVPPPPLPSPPPNSNPFTAGSSFVSGPSPVSNLPSDFETELVDSLHDQVQGFLDKLADRGLNATDTKSTLRQVIHTNQKFQRQLKRALAAGGREAIEEIFRHPLIRIPTATIEAWLQEES
ncbi:flotillin family protein [Prochlorothrix hollandica]|uniref:Flotillin n=1 Tax=Prochlorothrix hollandica PCC 9006 = CALU 1027 TaxID=317619 RepID=A0A0M2PX35_PROHO|nr:SPFH domain-containing protein [Prochlorothrix hollandica]KKJ00740.1 flotillin [Prochlorothrix hollandica PCC 9006 = CALU 1027]